MKHIKTLLAIATAALLGSSAWATDHNIKLHVGETSEIQTCGYVKEGKAQARWFKLDDGSAEIATATFIPASKETPYKSATGKDLTAPEFTFTGVKEGTTTWKAYTYTDCGQEDMGEEPGYSSPNTSYPSGLTKGSDGKSFSGQWANTLAHNFIIEVVADDVIIPQELDIMNTSDRAVTVEGGEATSAWTAEIVAGGDYVTLDKTSGTGATFSFTIGTKAVGTAQVDVTRDGKKVAQYNVTVSQELPVIEICEGDQLALNFYDSNYRNWQLDPDYKGGTYAAAGGQTVATYGYELIIMALKEGSETIRVQTRANTQDAQWAVYDGFRLRVKPARTETYALVPFSVDCACSEKSAGNATWEKVSGNASVVFENQSAGGVTAVVTAAEAGEDTIVIKNVTATNAKGAEYSLAFNFAEKPDVIEPVFVTATRARFTADRVLDSDEQYEGFLTTKGARYAWGADGKPLTDWVVSDGTPCDLAKPAEATQLLTIKAK